ncbi:unnamed protein product [Hyaloperonospora brassicae]|uniref:WW domain-containing protein n=1 Tax=Hyaloperonospora brassicae TaxID=162125 RepID=A0AAV0T552_HYABA|nr:unnamed protein product [Hyaloperonospora brassicae]
MPPQSAAAAAERLRKELAAQRARTEALKHLEATSSGPSQKELAQQQQLRQQQTTNVTSAVAQRRLLGAQPREPSVADKLDPRVRDNTLHALARRRAQTLQKTRAVEQMTESYRVEPKTTEYNASSAEWQELVDRSSGESYFWNKTTNETVWERPERSSIQVQAQETEAGAGSTTREGQLPDGWEEVPDATSGDVYYWNRKSNETTWTRPILRNVALVQAIQAKAKLDNILKGCGKAQAVGSRSSTNATDGKTLTDPSVPSAASCGVASSKRRAETVECSGEHGDKRHKRSGRDDDAVEPLERTYADAKWSEEPKL